MIFQSTFPRGERQIPFRQSTHPPNFNPRSRVGNDSNGYIAVLDSVSFQSTFPRGERPFPLGFHCQTVNFNPRSRVGNDLTECTPVSLIRFQSTFPRGERRKRKKGERQKWNFNPRSRVGNDHEGRVFARQSNNFNPRSRVGNDIRRHRESLTYCGFQSTFPRGERRYYVDKDSVSKDFNPRSRVGNDRLSRQCS